MAFVVTDLEVVMILAAVLIVVYIIGSYWKHRTLTSYAHWFDENLSSRGKVKFASHGHAGLRIKCESGDQTKAFKEMHFALTLGARENLMYYPFAVLKQDPDSLNCWAILHRPVQSNLLITKLSDKKRISSLQNNPRLEPLELGDLQDIGYVAFASNRGAAMEILSRASIPTSLKSMRIKSIEVDKPSSVLRVVADLRRDSLPNVVDFVFALANSV